MSGDAKERFTGERFIPGVEDDEITIEHYQRYESILDIVKGKVVVDAACGEGYGTSVIGSVASSVLGIDIDEETVAYAKKKYENEKIRFEVGSVEKINLPDESVDVFVSFETIEHVPENIQKAFVAEAARVLKADGIFVISSPNKAIYSDYFSYNNKFHVHELYKEEFLGMLGEYFPYVKLY
jgi:2-polyprenyl-3-methyl-5-hydroxy-6-metoxy-1,4-benzoquinol methylase